MYEHTNIIVVIIILIKKNLFLNEKLINNTIVVFDNDSYLGSSPYKESCQRPIDYW